MSGRSARTIQVILTVLSAQAAVIARLAAVVERNDAALKGWIAEVQRLGQQIAPDRYAGAADPGDGESAPVIDFGEFRQARLEAAARQAAEVLALLQEGWSPEKVAAVWAEVERIDAELTGGSPEALALLRAATADVRSAQGGPGEAG